jgi:hypothetical protein
LSGNTQFDGTLKALELPTAAVAAPADGGTTVSAAHSTIAAKVATATAAPDLSVRAKAMS